MNNVLSFNFETISLIVDFIILVGALCLAITRIYDFFAKPTSSIKKKRVEETKKQIETVLDEKMPDILLQHDLETRNKYLADRQQYLIDIKEEVLNDTRDTLTEIYQLNLQQNESIHVLTQTSKDVLRQRIMDIYHKYKAEKRMPIHAKEALDELYKDYKAEKGNSYIDKYYKRMLTWEIYDDEDYID